MPALLQRSEQAISVTEVSRSAKKLFDELSRDDNDHYVVMRNNVPIAVLMSVAEYETLLDELDDLRVEHLAIERLATLDDKNTIDRDEIIQGLKEADNGELIDHELIKQEWQAKLKAAIKGKKKY